MRLLVLKKNEADVLKNVHSGDVPLVLRRSAKTGISTRGINSQTRLKVPSESPIPERACRS
jgi:hypothetical protein